MWIKGGRASVAVWFAAPMLAGCVTAGFGVAVAVAGVEDIEDVAVRSDGLAAEARVDETAEARVDETVDVSDRPLIEAFSRALGSLAHGLVLWIGDSTDYDVELVLAEPPHIRFAPVGAVVELDGDPLPITPAVGGAYGPVNNTLVIALPWDVRDTYQQSILLHELVHAVQLSAHDWHCLAETEWEAYQLQRQWLKEHGLELAIDWIRVGMEARCPPLR